VSSLNDPRLVAREFASTMRLEMRRLDRTAWLRGEGEPWLVALAAIAEIGPRRVLDAGCGAGDFALLIASPEVVAIDSSPAMIERAQTRGLDARYAEIEDLPFAEGEFDVVTCNWVLYHLQELDRGLAELARVLRPGGRFVGIYNAPEHLDELWSAVGDPWGTQDTFDCPTGAAALERHFARVEARHTHNEALWESREALQKYLDAYVEMTGPLEAPPGPYPFRATRRNCVLVAEKS
jgi:ubiquinone/menaquinone biosynthesis C-methylase UbiE